MSAREFLDWQRFEAMHQPLPDQLSDIHIGMVCSMMVNIMRSADTAPVKPSDFFVLRDRAPVDDGLSEVDRLRLQWRGG